MARTPLPFFFDCGNYGIKSRSSNGSITTEDHFVHAFAQLDDGEFRRVTAQASKPDEEYFTVNGTHYAIGNKGKRHGAFERRYGAKRYNKDYYGVFLAIAMTRSFQRSTDVYLVGSHAPGDVDYTNDLLDAAMGDWVVGWQGSNYKFSVKDGFTYHEPLGGWANTAFRADGKAYARRDMNDGVTLVLDIGGYTTDGLVIDPGGSIDYSTANSVKVGVLNAVRDFEKNFRTQNAALLKTVGTLNESMINEAIRTGIFDLRGLGKINCAALAQETRQSLVNDVYGFYESYGGATEYNNILLTGGGSELLYTELLAAIQHTTILVADPKQEMGKLFLSNVRGGEKWYLLQKAIGSITV